MTENQILAGRTHTARMLLGQCSTCGLIHPPLDSGDACERYRSATALKDELSAWRSLKAAVREQSQRSIASSASEQRGLR